MPLFISRLCDEFRFQFTIGTDIEIILWLTSNGPVQLMYVKSVQILLSKKKNIRDKFFTKMRYK